MKGWHVLLVAGAVLAAPVLATAELPPEAVHPLEVAKALVGGGDWSGAINAYADHLSKLTTRDYRDKKTFQWILDAYEKQAPESGPDYEAFKDILKAKLPKSTRDKADPVLTWRVHDLLARIAKRQDKAEDARKALEKAIETYPDVPYGEPAAQSRLQHLYNEVALMRAEDDLAGAEAYLLGAFLKDPRFDFVYLPPWRALYESAGTPEQYQAWVTRVIEAYDKKIKEVPAKADMLHHYRWLLQQELPPPPAAPPEPPAAEKASDRTS